MGQGSVDRFLDVVAGAARQHEVARDGLGSRVEGRSSREGHPVHRRRVPCWRLPTGGRSLGASPAAIHRRNVPRTPSRGCGMRHRMDLHGPRRASSLARPNHGHPPAGSGRQRGSQSGTAVQCGPHRHDGPRHRDSALRQPAPLVGRGHRHVRLGCSAAVDAGDDRSLRQHHRLVRPEPHRSFAVLQPVTDSRPGLGH